jgi:DNA-binding NarL/FixJ family response regulator
MDWWLERKQRAWVLTPREREITGMVSHGFSNKEIARRLDINEGTVKVHLHQIYQKTGVPNRTALTVWSLSVKSRPDD